MPRLDQGCLDMVCSRQCTHMRQYPRICVGLFLRIASKLRSLLRKLSFFIFATKFFEDVFPKKNREVFYGIAMVPTMVDTSMEIGQLQKSSKVESTGLHSSKTHSNLLKSVIDVKEQAT
ncbi:hypothetical protein PIB30_097207 [Stylosanthes scabra]|uniref:Uncharacterized protein n=1 Tax=Stylosanthes scabra TaxID=79078 RepID=A0ABU6YY24_9FABA|nr:hypothetical protein [Stylosanthes scabra]